MSPADPLFSPTVPRRKTSKEHLMSTALWIAVGIAVVVAVVAGIKKSRG
ncbi:hypothetical protein ACIP39_16845 [Streptomyces tibetensis]